MYKTISNQIIRDINPYYNPSRFIKDENEELPIKDWILKYRNTVPADDIVKLLCRNEFLSEKDLRLFAVWCAREALKLVENPDPRSIEACNMAERYANGEATKEELISAARSAEYAADAAYAAADAAYDTNRSSFVDAYNYFLVANVVSYAVSYDSVSYAVSAYGAAANATLVNNNASVTQIDQLLTYF